MHEHGCPTWQWQFKRLWVRQCPDCGTWWKAQPVHLSGWGGNWERAAHLSVWWAQRRSRVVHGDEQRTEEET